MRIVSRVGPSFRAIGFVDGRRLVEADGDRAHPVFGIASLMGVLHEPPRQKFKTMEALPGYTALGFHHECREYARGDHGCQASGESRCVFIHFATGTGRAAVGAPGTTDGLLPKLFAGVSTRAVLPFAS